MRLSTSVTVSMGEGNVMMSVDRPIGRVHRQANYGRDVLNKRADSAVC